MLPVFLVEETTVRESGQSAVFDASRYLTQNLLLTFGITHAVEKESIGLDIYGSDDAVVWSSEPLVTFAPRSYCGTYELTLRHCEARYMKAVWSVKRWSRGEVQPFFCFYLFVRPARPQVAKAGAA